MFTPIKNFITYIQKNASGSTFFGGTSSNAEINDGVVMESEIVDTNSITQNPHLEELPNVMEKNHDQNENELLQDCSGSSSIGDDPLMIKEGDEEKDVFLEFPSVAESNEDNEMDFTVGEVIVLDDPDLNTSVISDPGTDPLAIDDCNGHSVTNSPNPLDSSGDGVVLYIDIDEMDGKPSRNIDEIEVEDANVLTTGKVVDEQEIRSDGSDSGLGSETSALQSTVTSVIDSSACSTASSSPVIEKIPLRSNLKRRLQDVDEHEHEPKKLRRTINFEGVKVFYFPRIQGHGCVPSQGGCTLGMGAHHISFKTFSLAEHAAELRRAHKLQLQEINPRGSSSEESDSDEELSEGSGSDLDAESNGFLQPVSPKQRRAILKAAGVRKIDPNEKIECRDIRNSREVCGCVCRDFCDPDTCACSQAGIKCQVDRAMFPCGCSRDACGNAIGRIEFNPARVRTHFIHTIMRLEMENRQQKRSDELGLQLNTAGSHMYNTVPAVGNSSTSMNTYSPMPSYGLEQSSTAMNHSYHHHHHMHQQHNAYLNHMPPGHTEPSVYTNLSNSLAIDAPPASLPLPQPHNNHYVNANATEPDSISSSLSMNGGNLHYQDGSIYPAVQATSLQPPATTAYCDMLAPYASSASYHNAQATDGNYPASAYNNFHSSHPLHNHLQHQQHQQPQPQQFLGYGSSCTGDGLNDFSETQSSFISLNTPDASSSRLSAINDLLHNNRNTTAALVAVTPAAEENPAMDRVEAVTYVPEESFTSKDEVKTEDSFKSKDEGKTEDSLKSKDEVKTEDSFKGKDEGKIEDSLKSQDEVNTEDTFNGKDEGKTEDSLKSKDEVKTEDRPSVAEAQENEKNEDRPPVENGQGVEKEEDLSVEDNREEKVNQSVEDVREKKESQSVEDVQENEKNEGSMSVEGESNVAEVKEESSDSADDKVDAFVEDELQEETKELTPVAPASPSETGETKDAPVIPTEETEASADSTEAPEAAVGEEVETPSTTAPTSESEEERITDKLPPIVETVSA